MTSSHYTLSLLKPHVQFWDSKSFTHTHTYRLGGYPPFSDEIKPYSLHDQICQARYSFPEQYWKGVSSEAIDMIKQLLTLDPGKRISSSAAIDHPWMKDQDVITKARKLMGGNSGCGLPGKVAMPPPNLPSVSVFVCLMFCGKQKKCICFYYRVV